MRREFDRSFALPPPVAETDTGQLLAIRIGAQPFALRLSEITGVHADKKLTRVPGSTPTMLGIVGFRGAITPVYDFAALMGHRRTDAPRWLVVAKAAQVALAFDGFEGQLRVAPDAIKPQQAHGAGNAFTRDFVQAESLLRPIVSLELVIGVLEK